MLNMTDMVFYHPAINKQINKIFFGFAGFTFIVAWIHVIRRNQTYTFCYRRKEKNGKYFAVSAIVNGAIWMTFYAWQFAHWLISSIDIIIGTRIITIQRLVNSVFAVFWLKWQRLNGIFSLFNIYHSLHTNAPFLPWI